MPTYDYKCEANGHPYTETRAMTEDQKQTTCTETDCASPLKRIFDSPPVTFNGVGFNARRG